MGASDALFGVQYAPEELGAEVNEDGIPVAETVTAVEVSGRDWPAEIDEATDADHLRELWRECKAWGEITTELDAHFSTRAGKLADSPVEASDAVEVHEDQAELFGAAS